MLSHTVAILAGGSGSRWGNYRNSPKHLSLIEGEILLERTSRQFLKYSKNVVIVSDSNFKNFIEKTNFYAIRREEEKLEMSKITSSFEIWSNLRTVLVFGDVYFTDEAVETIMTNSKKFAFFGRSRESKITGKPYKEMFALAFDKSENKKIYEAANFLSDKIKSAGGWALVRYLLFGVYSTNPQDRRIFDTDSFVEIDDWTEDFDYPKDLETWESLRQSQ